MSREIKFRIFHIEWKEMSYSIPFEGNQPKREYIPFAFPIGVSYYKPENLSPLMQFIGLKDKHGKEIYEGDIVSFIDTNDYGDPYIGVINFNGGMFCISTKYSTFSMNHITEVIGNIYENPELLENGSNKEND